MAGLWSIGNWPWPQVPFVGLSQSEQLQTVCLLTQTRRLPAARTFPCRLIIVSNVLPIRGKKEAHGWEFEWDQDALVAQAKVSRTGGYSIRPAAVLSALSALPSVSCAPCPAASKLALLTVRLASGLPPSTSLATKQQLLMCAGLTTPHGASAVLCCVQEGIPDEYDVVYVGSLSVEVDPREQDVSGSRGSGGSKGSGSGAVASQGAWV
jgi:hypothetical protein